MVQHPGGSAGAAAAPEGPGIRPVATEGAAGTPARGMPPTGEFDRTMDRDPSGSPGPLSPGRPAEAPHPGTPPGEAPRDAGPPVLQDGVLQPDGQPQGEHGARPGLVCEAGGVRKARDGNRGGGMGGGPRGCRESRGPEDHDLLGPRGARLEEPATVLHEALWRGRPRAPAAPG